MMASQLIKETSDSGCKLLMISLIPEGYFGWKEDCGTISFQVNTILMEIYLSKLIGWQAMFYLIRKSLIPEYLHSVVIFVKMVL